MKHARKLASLLLALVMVFALATTAFAAEAGTTTTTGTITVANPVENQTYIAYKIFDVVYDNQNHYSYTIGSSNPWYDTVAAYAATEGNGLTLTQVNGGDTYVVTTDDGFSAPDFAAALKKAINGKAGKTLSGDAGSVTVSGLDLGYYFVSSDGGALCNLTTTNPTATIHDKNDMHFEKKADATTVEVGQTVNYTIIGKVPAYTGFNTYTYRIEDTMTDGLTFKKDVKVTVGGTDVTDDCTVNYDVNENANSFTVTVPVLEKKYKIGAEIKATYSATVNEKAIAVVSENEAKLIYSNNPTSADTGTITPPVVKVYSAKIDIDTYEAGKEDTKLPGAIFVLYKRGEGTTTKPASGDYDTVTVNGTTTYYPRSYYKYTNATATEGAKVDWVADKVAATAVTTGDKGEATFGGLANGDYYLVETKAPDGYNQLTEPHKVTVAGSSTDTTKLTAIAKVANSTGTERPSTGGMGTTVFYVLGFALVMGAVVLLVTKKRMSDANG